MNPDFDIVIVGGGLAGASLACALRASDLKSALIEASPPPIMAPPTRNERTVALAFGSRRIFEGMGVWQEIDRLGVTAIERIHVSHRGGFGVARLQADEIGLPALGYVVENRVLGAALWKTLESVNNIERYCPASLEALEVGSDTVTVHIKQGDRSRGIAARLVIGADGAQSAVRRLAGIDADTREYSQVAIVATVATERPQPNTAYERFTATGPLALLPMRDDRYAMVWSARADEAEAILVWSDGEFLDRLQDRFGDRLGRFSDPGARSRYPLALMRVPQPIQERLCLIGNAAHTVHPVAGQGFNLGLRDVATLAETLVAAVRAGEDIGSLPVLRRYADRRARDTRATELLTDGLIRVFSSEFAPLRWARGLGLIAVDAAPPVKRRLLRMTGGLAGRLPGLARGLPL